MNVKTTNQANDCKEGLSLKWVFLVSIVIIFSWLTVFLLIKYLGGGQTDDAFSGTDSLFSALAFGGVITAIFLQREELKLQRRELSETREVLKKQHEQLEAHTQAFAKQNFESTLFSLLNLHNTIVNSMSVKEPEGVTEGRDCFLLLHKELKGSYSLEKSRRPEKDEKELLEEEYFAFYQYRQPLVGHYFRNLYNIVRFIKDSGVKDKFFYIRLIRSQLSVYELSLLFYNCLSGPGKGFKPLVEEFALLKTIEDIDIFDPSHRQYYKPAAFE